VWSGAITNATWQKPGHLAVVGRCPGENSGEV
jgi:hypothetical protein